MGAQPVGERLREIRRQKHLSLRAVEDISRQEFKANALSAYERGERTISVLRLVRLAEVYGVSVDQLLPRVPDLFDVDIDIDIDLTEPCDTTALDVTIDLARLGEVEDYEAAAAVARLVAGIVSQRQAFRDNLLALRHNDVLALAALVGQQPEELTRRLEHLDLLAPRAVHAPRTNVTAGY
jgi:transcriptional regulator with XRE-family HTH domain